VSPLAKRLAARRRIGTGDYIAVGDDTTTATPASSNSSSPSLSDALGSDTVKTAAGIALVYHGYKRTGSLLWALFYGAAGKYIPLVAVPVAVAQGFGKTKKCTVE